MSYPPAIWDGVVKSYSQKSPFPCSGILELELLEIPDVGVRSEFLGRLAPGEGFSTYRFCPVVWELEGSVEQYAAIRNQQSGVYISKRVDGSDTRIVIHARAQPGIGSFTGVVADESVIGGVCEVFDLKLAGVTRQEPTITEATS